MTAVTVEATAADSLSPDSFWESKDLPELELEPAQELPPDTTEYVNPPEKVCPACGEEIVRVPGTKGRLPKYHPQCKPAKGSASGPRPIRVSAKDRLIAEQVEEALAQIEQKVNRAIILLAIADPYDALVLRVNLPELLSNLRPVLMQFSWARNAATNTSAGASVVGFIVVLLTTALPILAHHKLIPSKKVAQILINVPLFMHKMQQQMMDNDADLTENLIEQVHEKARRERETLMRQQAYAENIHATPTR